VADEGGDVGGDVHGTVQGTGYGECGQGTAGYRAD
jgi:hypothetical protein